MRVLLVSTASGVNTIQKKIPTAKVPKSVVTQEDIALESVLEYTSKKGSSRLSEIDRELQEIQFKLKSLNAAA